MPEHIVKHYKNGDLTIQWEPEKCIHAGICARDLPEVFRPKERPWVHAEAADPDTIAAVIDKCPTGAISYTREGAAKTEATPAPESSTAEPTVMNISDTGPILMSGPLDIKYKGEDIQVPEGKKVAICRCGASASKPYCDGAHSKIKFEG